MPLHDHFHPPLSVRRHWHSFHSAWATYLAADLNGRLPKGYFAEPNVQFGIEIDIAAFERSQGAGLAAVSTWSPPAPSQSISFPLVTDHVEVHVFGTESGPTLAGAIELVSPANKDRPEHRSAFVAKCETYLQQGVGLVIVDIVTSRKDDLHRSLLERWNATPNSTSPLYAGAFRPVEREQETKYAAP